MTIVKRANSPFAGINVDTGNVPNHGYALVAFCLADATNAHLKTRIADESGSKQDADWPRLANMFRTPATRVSSLSDTKKIETLKPLCRRYLTNWSTFVARG